MNALGWAYCGAQLATNTFLHTVFIFIENMTTVQTLRLLKFFVHLDRAFFVATKHSTTRVLRCNTILFSALTKRDYESAEVSH